MKNGPFLELEVSGLGPVNLAAGDIGRQQVRRELDAVKVALEMVGQGLDGCGLGQPGGAFHQQVPIGQQGDQQPIHQRFLTDNPFG